MNHTFAQILENPSNYKSCVDCGQMLLKEVKECVKCHKTIFIPDTDIITDVVWVIRGGDKHQDKTDEEFLQVEYTVS